MMMDREKWEFRRYRLKDFDDPIEVKTTPKLRAKIEDAINDLAEEMQKVFKIWDMHERIGIEVIGGPIFFIHVKNTSDPDVISVRLFYLLEPGYNLCALVNRR